MSNKEKEEIIRALDSLDIELDRVIKLSELIPEKGDRENIDELINMIIALTDKLKKII
jgi:hypothetical protein